MAKDVRRRVVSANPKSEAGLLLGDKEAALIGNKKHFIVVDDRGVTIKGPVSMVADASQIRKSGIFIGMPDMLRQIPSTIITPIPPHQPLMPVGGLAALAKDVAFFVSLLV